MSSNEDENPIEVQEQPQVTQTSAETIGVEAGDAQNTATEVTEEVVLDGAAPSTGKGKGKRNRSHPVWDSSIPFEGRPICDVRKKLCLVQCNACNPWQPGKKVATWNSIATSRMKQSAFRGIELAGRGVEDRVTLWLDSFSTEDRGNRSATGTDDEEFSSTEALLTELLELRDSTNASAKAQATDKQEALRKKKADTAGACSLLDSSAKGLATKEVARNKKAKREFAKLNDNELHMDLTGEAERSSTAKRGSANFNATLLEFLGSRKGDNEKKEECRQKRLALQERQLAIQEKREERQDKMFELMLKMFVIEQEIYIYICPVTETVKMQVCWLAEY
ncbi:hypothetical protein CYMTET_8608 [Cymbomonas tetramitiformis]|uniref:No apical meristem-associated C-terminal domain-containing protein n=1 Tax=Cymbomonas tetramitiformis TaxID=36881 RepID=A0AAE0LGC4_9CHLO|nr:hypothetical protein CYMTET_8608 [Cymbomonas tetramitiformis]